MTKERFEEILKQTKVTKDTEIVRRICEENQITDLLYNLGKEKSLIITPVMINSWPAIVCFERFNKINLSCYAIPPKFKHEAHEFFPVVIAMLKNEASEKIGREPSSSYVTVVDSPKQDQSRN